MARPPRRSPILELIDAARALPANEAAFLRKLDAGLITFARVLDVPSAVEQLRVLLAALGTWDAATFAEEDPSAWQAIWQRWEALLSRRRTLIRALDGDGYELLALHEEAAGAFASVGLLRRARAAQRERDTLAARVVDDGFRRPTEAQRALLDRALASRKPRELDLGEDRGPAELLALGDQMIPPLHPVRDAVRAAFAVLDGDPSAAVARLSDLVSTLEREGAAPLAFAHVADVLDVALWFPEAQRQEVEAVRFRAKSAIGAVTSHQEIEHLLRRRQHARQSGDLRGAIALTERLIALEPAGTPNHYRQRILRLELLASLPPEGEDLVAALEAIDAELAGGRVAERASLRWSALSVLRNLAARRGSLVDELAIARRMAALPAPRFEDHDASEGRAAAHADLASLLRRLSRYAEARQHLQSAIEALGEAHGALRLDLTLGQVELEREAGQTAAARTALARAEALADALTLRPRDARRAAIARWRAEIDGG